MSADCHEDYGSGCSASAMNILIPGRTEKQSRRSASRHECRVQQWFAGAHSSQLCS